MRIFRLDKDCIYIYKTELSKDAKEIKLYESFLSEEEIHKASRFRLMKLTNNYITCRGILRKILSYYLNIKPSSVKFSYTANGKPFVYDSSLKFNLSHTKTIVVYAFTLNDEIGIDTEKLRVIPDSIRIAERFFSSYERVDLKTVPRDQIDYAFLNCWTRKESFIKARGEGLSYPLKNFSVSVIPGSPPEILWIKDKDYEPAEWALHDINISNDHLSSLAIKNKNKKIVYCDSDI